MKSYTIFSPMNNSLSFVDFKEITNTIEKNISNNQIQTEEDSESAMQEYKVGKNSIYIYYTKNDVQVLMDNKLKQKFESKTKLILEEIN
ncbi:hypothetical protein KAI04_02770 [Candidatus Pacearchaeota archaeon]|nr:hypothetical protein [Candidatus Pacearchaeota archaeon]